MAHSGSLIDDSGMKYMLTSSLSASNRSKVKISEKCTSYSSVM